MNEKASVSKELNAKHKKARVANVDWIKIMAEEHISLMEGSTKDLQILAGTQDGQIFGNSELSVKGGPKTRVSVEYSTLNREIVELQNITGKLSAKSLGNSGDLFFFYETCQSYNWMIADEKVVIFQSAKSWQDRFDQGLYSDGKNSPWLSSGSSKSFITHMIGRSAGKTKISVSVTCDFLLPGTSGSVVSYNASKTIFVVPDPPLALVLPMTWLFPPFYTTTSLLPRSANSLGEPNSLDLESSIGYSLLRGSGRIIAGSKIQTGESNVVDCIQAKDHSAGRTEIAACLRVAEVGC